MSVVYAFPLPTTGVFAFSQCISSAEHYQLLADADTHRGRLRDVLKRAKRKNVQDMLEVVKIIEDYIPYAVTIKEGLESGELRLDTEIVTSWRLPLSGSHLHVVVAPPRVQVPTIYFELSMTLLTYALALLALAEETYAVGSPERWKQITAHLLSAQSVLLYLSTHPLQLSTPAPLDLQPSTLSPLISLISGSLHLLILYKPSTTSFSLLKRVSIFALEKFSAAASLVPAQLLNDGLHAWLRDAKAYASAVTQKYMALDSEAKHEVGTAIALCVSARADLKPSLKDKLKKTNEPVSGIQASMKLLRQDIEELEKGFRAQNDTVTFQKVPDVRDVRRNWPSGREVVAMKGEWVPPKLLAGFGDDEAEEGFGGQAYY